MKVGNLVRVKKPSTPNKKYLGKLGVIIKVTISSQKVVVGVHIFGSNNSWKPRFAKEKLEVITCK